MALNEKKKYNYMENVLQSINKNYISLSEEEVKRNNKVLEDVLNQIITKMEKNVLFKYLFQRVFYGGSYYDGLKVGEPEEFDLDLLLALPKYAEPTLTISNIPGFVHLHLKEMQKFEKQPEAHRFTDLSKLIDKNNYLITSKVSAWIESIARKVLNEFPQSQGAAIFNTASGKFSATIHKGGPAHTLKLSGTVNNKKVMIDVDLVPCFVFTKEKWPSSPYRTNKDTSKSEFFIVPKKPAGAGNLERYWRLSFQEQERAMINGSGTLKPALKLLKKLRDKSNHKAIASYYIKTVFLWEVDKNNSLWENSLSYVFMTMLKEYHNFLKGGKIPFFWNKNNNLLGKCSATTLQGFANALQNIIESIEKHPDDPFVIAKYLVNGNEIEKLKSETVIGKKTLKRFQNLSISDGMHGGILMPNSSTTGQARL